MRDPADTFAQPIGRDTIAGTVADLPSAIDNLRGNPSPEAQSGSCVNAVDGSCRMAAEHIQRA